MDYEGRGGQGPVVVEFVGHAGSGKTFLKERLMEELDGICDIAGGGGLKVSEVAAFALFNPVVTLAAIRLVIGSRLKSIGLTRRALVKVFAYQVKMRRRHVAGPRALVCCEGMLHRLRMLRSASGRERLTYASLAPQVRRKVFSRPDLVVFVVASLETTSLRRFSRRDEDAQEEGVLRMVARKKQSFDRSLQETEENILAAQRDHGFRYLKVTNERDSEIEPILRTIENEIRILEAKEGEDAALSQKVEVGS